MYSPRRTGQHRCGSPRRWATARWCAWCCFAGPSAMPPATWVRGPPRGEGGEASHRSVDLRAQTCGGERRSFILSLNHQDFLPTSFCSLTENPGKGLNALKPSNCCSVSKGKMLGSSGIFLQPELASGWPGRMGEVGDPDLGGPWGCVPIGCWSAWRCAFCWPLGRSCSWFAGSVVWGPRGAQAPQAVESCTTRVISLL